MQKYAYLDLDAVAYTGACIAEKLAYQWRKLDGTETSEEFPKAADAKLWYEQVTEFGQIDPVDWERVTVVKLQDEKTAFEGLENEIKKWVNATKKLAGKDVILKGFLTSSGLKNKDIKGLQDRYQHNRIGKVKPTHLKACRNYLLTSRDWIRISPFGVEADAIVVGLAERRGQNGVAVFKDKDLRQVMDCGMIEMNNSNPRLEVSTVVGDLRYTTNAKGIKKFEGEGFKLICFQTAVGDSADGYKGIAGFGPVAGYELLKGCTTPKECCEALVDLYETKFPDGITYKAWDGEVVTRTAHELLTQHMQLAYHERSKDEKTNPIGRFLNGEKPIYPNGGLK